MVSGVYLMGKFLQRDVTLYKRLAERGKKFMETELYDGEYFIQKIQVDGLNAKNPAAAHSFGGEYSKEARELLEKEGPKYQYGVGCLSNGKISSKGCDSLQTTC